MAAKAPLWRQRLPFLGLLGSGLAGILLAASSPIPSGVFLSLLAVALGVWVFARRAVWVYLAVAAAFAALHVWQTRESPAALLAERLGEVPRVAYAEGVLRSDPAQMGSAKARFVLRVEMLEIDGERFQAPCDILVVAPLPPPGLEDRVRLVGSLRRILEPRNPGQFDAPRAMALRGITCELLIASPTDVEILRPASGFSLRRLAAQCQRWMESTLREGLSGEPLVSDLLAGLVLGVTSDIPGNLQDQFRQTGTFHLFSVSGLHVGMIAVILWQLLRTAGAGRGLAVFLIIPALFFYALTTGWKPSSVRAATMSAIFLIGMISSRQPMPVNSLCAAGFVILAQSTNELFNPGFQLSFTVVAAILLVAGPIQNWLRSRLQPDPFLPAQLWTLLEKMRSGAGAWLAGLLAVSIAAWLGALPLTLLYFQMVSLSSFLANPVVVPLAFVIMATAMAALAGGVVSAGLAAVFNNANLVFTKILILIIQAVAALPGSYLSFAPPDRASTTVTVFDFGPGGGAGIESAGQLWLLDCGSLWDFQSSVTPWMRSNGKWIPDGLLLTHGDADHIGGAADLLEGGPPRVVIDSAIKDRSPVRNRLHRDMDRLGIPKSIHRIGDRIQISPLGSLHILYPPTGGAAGLSDDKVLVARLDTPRARVLFLSDSGPTTTTWLLENSLRELPADILVVGRHRSGIPPEATFLNAVNPSLLVATAAGFPTHEPIDEEWAAMVRESGIHLFRQDESGAVSIRFFDGDFEAEGFVNGQKIILPLR